MALLRLPLARYWLYSVWYALACRGRVDLGPARGRPLGSPGDRSRLPALLRRGIVRPGSPDRRGLCGGAALAAPPQSPPHGYISASPRSRRRRPLRPSTATPVFILLVGNAILALDAQAREPRRSCRAAREPRGAAIRRAVAGGAQEPSRLQETADRRQTAAASKDAGYRRAGFLRRW